MTISVTKSPSKVHLEVDSAVTPVLHPPGDSSLHVKPDPTKADRDGRRWGIIVKEVEHSPWIPSMLVIYKRKGKEKNNPPTKDIIRLYIDSSDFKRAVKTPHYPMATVEQAANKLTGAQIFSTLDACSDFWQLLVDEESSKLLTFNAPWGSTDSHDFHLA